jgi:hypothetical protein
MTVQAPAPGTTFPVKTLTGHELELQTQQEQDYYRGAQHKYTTENKFTVASDLRSLERLILYEVMMFRWQSQLASGRDYDSAWLTATEADQLRKNIKETAPLVSQIQNDLGLTKSQREREQFESVGAYIQRVQLAAKEHGVRREKQLGRALELVNELFSLCGAYARSNENERRKLGFESPDDIIEWVLTYMKPRYDEIDEYFRKHQQRFWLRNI